MTGMACGGDGDGWHAQDCSGVAVALVRQPECPPGCDHPLSQRCLAYARTYGTFEFVVAPS